MDYPSPSNVGSDRQKSVAPKRERRSLTERPADTTHTEIEFSEYVSNIGLGFKGDYSSVPAGVILYVNKYKEVFVPWHKVDTITLNYGANGLAGLGQCGNYGLYSKMREKS